MMPTPTVTDTATISAAIATAVRLSVATMLRPHKRPSVPPHVLRSGWSRRMQPTVASGVISTQPRSTPNREPKLSHKFVPDSHRPPRPAASASRPRSIVRGAVCRARVSRLERCKVTRGGVAVASQAGLRAASRLAPMPSSMPLPSTTGVSASSRTVRTKYRSVIVRVTSCTRPWLSRIPRPSPPTVPTPPINTASPSTNRKISRRVTPWIRSRPSRPRRWTTEKVMVL